MVAIHHVVNFLSAATTQAESQPWVVIILALISASGVIITAWFSFMAQKHAKYGAKQSAEANDAVNHRGPDQDRLFDMVASTRDSVQELALWKEQWDSVPTGFQDPSDLVTNFRVIEDRINNIGERLDNRVLHLHTHIDTKVSELNEKVSDIDQKLTDHMNDTNKLKNINSIDPKSF